MTEHALAVSVAQAGLPDLDALVPLFDAYRVFYEQPSDPDGARTFLEGNLEREGAVIFFAHTGDRRRPLGFTQLYPTLSSVSMKRLWTLNDLYVVPEARGQGTARALMAAAEEWARRSGAKGLQLSTAADNRTAQRLYEGVGYGRDEVFYHYYKSVEE